MLSLASQLVLTLGVFVYLYVYTIIHEIAEYWPQSVNQLPQLWTGLFIEMIGSFGSILGLLILLLEHSRLVIIQR